VGILTRSEQMAWTIARCSEIGTGTFLLKLRIACGVELRSTDSRGRLSPQKASAVLHELVAAGVVLVGDQDQAWADGDWFRL